MLTLNNIYPSKAIRSVAFRPNPNKILTCSVSSVSRTDYRCLNDTCSQWFANANSHRNCQNRRVSFTLPKQQTAPITIV